MKRLREPKLASALLAAATSTLSAAPATAGFDAHLAVVSTDFTTSGSLSSMGLCQPFETAVDVEPVGGDPVIRHAGGKHYVVNRFGNDAIQVIDAATHETLIDFSVGPGSNPQDIVLLSETRAYVSRFGSRWLYLVDPTTGTIVDSLDLGSFADADGRPEMAYMALDGDHLLVQLQRLDTDGFFDPVPPSYLAVVDVTANALVDVDPGTSGVQAIQLTGTNPHQKMHLDPAGRRLFVSELGAFGVLDGGLEAVDLDALAALGFVVSEATLGADISSPAIASSTKGYALTSDDFFGTVRVTILDLGAGTSGGTLFTTPAFTSALALDPETGKLYLGDRETSAPGIRVFDSSNDTQITGSPISVGLPPADIALARPAAVGLGETVAGARAHPSAAPNPFRTTTVLRFASAGAAELVDLFDASGRRVRTLRALGAGTQRHAEWDGTGERGRSMPPGVYTYRVRRGGATGRVVRIR